MWEVIDEMATIKHKKHAINYIKKAIKQTIERANFDLDYKFDKCTIVDKMLNREARKQEFSALLVINISIPNNKKRVTSYKRELLRWYNSVIAPRMGKVSGGIDVIDLKDASITKKANQRILSITFNIKIVRFDTRLGTSKDYNALVRYIITVLTRFMGAFYKYKEKIGGLSDIKFSGGTEGKNETIKNLKFELQKDIELLYGKDVGKYKYGLRVKVNKVKLSRKELIIPLRIEFSVFNKGKLLRATDSQVKRYLKSLLERKLGKYEVRVKDIKLKDEMLGWYATIKVDVVRKFDISQTRGMSENKFVSILKQHKDSLYKALNKVIHDFYQELSDINSED